MMPRVAGQRWLRCLREEHGRSYAEQLGREVMTYRELWAVRLAERKVG